MVSIIPVMMVMMAIIMDNHGSDDDGEGDDGDGEL